MKLTTKGRFAVTAMLDIALHDPEEYVSIAAIGDRRHLSSAYLEQIFESCAEQVSLKGCAVLPAATVWLSPRIKSR